MTNDALVIGGGMAGMLAAWRLAKKGKQTILIEKNDHLGGLASSFEKDGRTYPLGYHHILSTDAHLISFLAELNLLNRVHWRRLEMGFAMGDHVYGLSSPGDFLRFPLPLRTKFRMAARAATAWLPMQSDEPASKWLSRVAGQSAVEAFFDPLTHIKFGLPTSALSAAWLRQRMQGREANCRYGYIPGDDWVKALIHALENRMIEAGVDIRLNTSVDEFSFNGDRSRITSAHLSDGIQIRPKVVVAAIAPPILSKLTKPVNDKAIDDIQYSGVISTVFATRDEVPLDRYWTNFVRPLESFGGIFRLDLLNESLGQPGVRLLNFCTHIRDRSAGSMLHWNESKIEARYLNDFEARFGVRFKPEWAHTSRIPFYSPIFADGYENPPVTHRQLGNLFLAGNHRTFPVLATTGSAMGSGAEAAQAALSSRHLILGAVGDTEAA